MSVQSAQKPKKMTVEEFLDWVEGQPVPYELVGGYPRPKWGSPEEMMAGTSSNHAIIAGNVLVALRLKLKGTSCMPYGSDHAVISAEEETFYPDVSVDCGFKDRSVTSKAAVKPVMVVEVFSPSTKNYDLGEKRLSYEETESIENIIYIEQDKVLVLLGSRQTGGAWLIQKFSSLSDIIAIPQLNTALALEEIYENVMFEE